MVCTIRAGSLTLLFTHLMQCQAHSKCSNTLPYATQTAGENLKLPEHLKHPAKLGALFDLNG